MRKLLILCCLFLTQTLHATTFGPLDNFDVVNDTGLVAHGFEIEIEDIHASNITSIFGDATRWTGMERYGIPVVTEFTEGTRFGVRVRYQDITKSTPSGTLPVSPMDSCWPYGAPNYGPNYPCDHFGVSTDVNTPKVKYSWIVETTPGSTANLVLTNADVPNPNWVVTPQPDLMVQPADPALPPVAVPQPPLVNVIVRAPEPVDVVNGEPQFGTPKWVRVTASAEPENVAVEDLMAENKVVKDAELNVQIEWQLLQTDPGNPAAGEVDLSGVQLDKVNGVEPKSIVYRFEYWEYTGAVKPADGEAQPVGGDTFPGAIGPNPADLGMFLVANNVAINLDGIVPVAPPLPAPVLLQDPPVITTTLVDGTVGTPYSANINVTPANVGDTVSTTVTGLPDGLSFNGTDTVSGTPLAPGGVSNVIINATDTITGKVASLLVVVRMDAVVVPVACNGINEHITFIAPRQGAAVNGWLSTTEGLNRVGYPNQANTILAPGLNTFVVGDVVQYGGFIDASGVFCIADTMTVSHVLNLPTMTFVNGQAGVNYPPVAITPTGGFVPFTINVTGLPTGMIFDGIDTISGTPTVAGTFTLTIDVTDKTGQHVMSFPSITVDTAPAVIVTAALASGTVGVNYNANVAASGGIGAITLKQTGLPAGLSLTGNIVSGTPTVSGTSNVTFTGTDTFGTTGSVISSLVINPAVVVPPVNTCPVSGVKSVGQFKVVAVGATSITMSNGKVVNYLPCTTISWNRKSQVFKVGDSVEWKGFIVGGSIVANKLTVN